MRTMSTFFNGCISRLLLFIIFPFLQANAQPLTPADYGLASYKIQDKQLGTISFYIDTSHLHSKAPLFIDINGSGGLPLCIYIKATNTSSVLNTFTASVIGKVNEKFHYIILDKPGTPFCDSITTGKKMEEVNIPGLMENYPVSKTYNEQLSLQWRVQATKKVIDWCIKNNFWDKSKIIAYGFSEGGQVVPSLAVSDKRITHAVPLVGCGLNQFYDGIIRWRIKAAKGEITQHQAQDSINALLETLKDIYTHPAAAEKQYDGHSYMRWASFCSTIPFEQLRKLDIPIYMIAGTADNNSPIYSLDYVLLDFMRLGKTNLTYDVCIGCDHWLVTHENGKRVEHFETYFGKILKWIDEH